MNYNIPIPSDFHDVSNELPRHPTRHWRHRDGSIRDVSFVMVHQQDGTGSLESVARYHVTPSPHNHISAQGCPAFCYHFSIDLAGNIYFCNDLQDIVWSGGSVKVTDKNRRPYPFSDKIKPGLDLNAASISVMLQGKFAGPGQKGLTDPTDEQIEAFARWLYWVTNPAPDGLGFDVKQVIGHCHGKANRQACPGFDYTDFIEEAVWSGQFRQAIDKQREVPPMPKIETQDDVIAMMEKVRAELARRFPSTDPLILRKITAEDMETFSRVQSLIASGLRLGMIPEDKIDELVSSN